MIHVLKKKSLFYLLFFTILCIGIVVAIHHVFRYRLLMAERVFEQAMRSVLLRSVSNSNQVLHVESTVFFCSLKVESRKKKDAMDLLLLLNKEHRLGDVQHWIGFSDFKSDLVEFWVHSRQNKKIVKEIKGKVVEAEQFEKIYDFAKKVGFRISLYYPVIVENKKNVMNFSGWVVRSSIPEGYGGNIELLVAFGLQGVLWGYSFLLHNETPGFGSLADEQKFKKYWMGMSVNDFPLTKKDFLQRQDVDLISGATITSLAVGRGLKRIVEETISRFPEKEFLDWLRSNSYKVVESPVVTAKPLEGNVSSVVKSDVDSNESNKKIQVKPKNVLQKKKDVVLKKHSTIKSKKAKGKSWDSLYD